MKKSFKEHWIIGTIITLIAVLSVYFTVTTLLGWNSIAELKTLSDDKYTVDISSVGDKESLKFELDLLADEARIEYRESQLEQDAKDLNARKESLE